MAEPGGPPTPPDPASAQLPDAAAEAPAADPATAGPSGTGVPASAPEEDAPPAPPEADAWPPWGIWEAAALLLFFALAQVAASLALPGLLRLLAPGPRSTAELIAIGLPTVVLVSHGVAWALVALRLQHHGLGWVAGLRLQRPVSARGSRSLLRPFLLGMLTQIVGVSLLSLFPLEEPWENPLIQFAEQGRGALLFLAFTAVVLAPLLEEVLFRGMLYPALRRRLGILPAALLVTVLFTALHGLQTGWYLPALLGITLAGAVLVWLRERTGSLAPAIAFHAGFNAVVLIPLLALGSAAAPTF